MFQSNFRNSHRTPMQWDNSTSAGFSSSTRTWLPIANNYQSVNVDLQKFQNSSHLKVFQKLVELRRTPTMKYGKLKIKSIGGSVIAYKRKIDGERQADIIAVVLNLSSHTEIVNIHSKLNLPKSMKIIISSIHFNNG